MGANDIVLTTVVPGVGVVLGNLMFCSVLPALLKARKEKNLGELNPVPYAAILVNCIGWVMYSVLLVDYFIFFGNAPGIILGFFYTLTGAFYGTSEEQRRKTELILIVLLSLLMIASFLIVFDHGVTNQNQDQLLLGSVAVFNLLVFYASPLSSLVTVVKTRDATSIYAPLSVISVINGSLWAIYGLFIQDYFVMGPNAFGALTGLKVVLLLILLLAKWEKAKLFLRFRYPASAKMAVKPSYLTELSHAPAS